MGVFHKWLSESLIAEPTIRTGTTAMAEKVEIAGGVAQFRQLVDDYRQQAGDGYDIDEDPLFMDADKFRAKYGKDAE